ncbi:pentapeptide repeat-containing protein [Candidatus Nanopelagicales bacterium]|nr:pentapeptide repeat-containing protein [Candidatus Nanopelagicales bacterium]
MRVVCVAVVGVLLLAGCGSDGNTASESDGDEPSLLYVQDADGGTLDGDQLTMVEVSPNTGWFTDRPAREAGQIATADFVTLWDEGGTFSEDPPNADFTCQTDGDTVNVVVELKSAVVNGRTLTYNVARIGDTPAGNFDCDSNAHLFIDNSTQCAELRNGSQTDMRTANLTGCNLEYAKLPDVLLNSTNLTNANLTGANLTGADLNSANLTGRRVEAFNRVFALDGVPPGHAGQVRAAQVSFGQVRDG